MRLTPLPADRWDGDVNAALASLLPKHRRNPEGAGNALATLVRHPELTKAFLPYNVHILFGSTLTPRQREIAILRVAALADSPYEIEHHSGMARALEMSDEEISDALGGIAADTGEQLILRAVGELHTTSTISDQTWTALSAHLDERQLMDLVFTVGAYTTLAMAFNTFGVEPDRELQPEYER